MKRNSIEAPCPCGERLTSEIAKPTHFTPTVTELVCTECGSKFLITCKKISADLYDFDVEALEISDRAKHIVAVDLGLRNPEQ